MSISLIVFLTIVTIATVFSVIASLILMDRVVELEKQVFQASRGVEHEAKRTRPFRRNDPLADDPPPGWERSD